MHIYAFLSMTKSHPWLFIGLVFYNWYLLFHKVLKKYSSSIAKYTLKIIVVNVPRLCLHGKWKSVVWNPDRNQAELCTAVWKTVHWFRLRCYDPPRDKSVTSHIFWPHFTVRRDDKLYHVSSCRLQKLILLYVHKSYYGIC